ncbi:MAG TPA: glycosyltransferase, partial [Streptosporangiaceae bacterium]
MLHAAGAPRTRPCPVDLRRRGSAPRRRPAALSSSPIAPLWAPPPPCRTPPGSPPASTKIHGTRPSVAENASPRVAAVVVTYNRRELLLESLAAVTSQTRPPDAVIVVDNASTDGSAV